MKLALVLPPAERASEKKDTPYYQHVGLGYLAAVLEKNNFNTTVIDAKLDRLDFDKTVKVIKEQNPQVLGITAMTHEINMAARLAKEIKTLAPDTFIAIGGVHVSALPIETIKAYPCFDAGVTGEGENTLPALIMSLAKGNRDFSDLKGIVYRRGTEVMLTQPQEKIKDLDTLPFPAWNKFPNASEYIVITSRGCPFSCAFCMQASGQIVRKRSAENVVNELEGVLAQRRPKRFLFYDETFTLDKGRVYDICDLIIKRGINRDISWAVTTRVDSIDRDLLLKMKEAGCNHIEFGIESGDQQVLDRIRKKIRLEQAEYAVGLAKKLGFHTEGAFIIGHPHETLETAYKTIDFAARLNTDIIQLGIMVPYPGTEVARLASEGKGGYKIISTNWSDYNKQLGDALELEDLNRKDLERLQLIGYLKLFIANNRYRGLIRFIFSYRLEMLSFLRNHFKKAKKRKKSQIGFLMMLRMVFRKDFAF